MGLVLHPRRDCSGAVGQVASWTADHGVALLAAEDDVARLGLRGVTPVSRRELADTSDALIALGGDGTLLGAMRLVADRQGPRLGVNLGRLGFLAEVEGRDLDSALAALAEGRGGRPPPPPRWRRRPRGGRPPRRAPAWSCDGTTSSTWRSTTPSWRACREPGWSR